MAAIMGSKNEFQIIEQKSFVLFFFTILAVFIFQIDRARAQGNITIGEIEFTGCTQVGPVEGTNGKESCCLSPADHPKSCTTLQTNKKRAAVNAGDVAQFKARQETLAPAGIAGKKFDYKKDFKAFCNQITSEVLNTSILVAQEGSARGKIDLEFLARNQKPTPCGSYQPDQAQKINDLFKSKVGAFCEQSAKKANGSSASHPNQTISGWVISPAQVEKSVQLDNSCVLGPVKLTGTHRLTNTVIVGTDTGEPLVIQLNSTDKAASVVTWSSGLFYGRGDLKFEKGVLQPTTGFVDGPSYSAEIDNPPADRSSSVVNLNAIAIQQGTVKPAGQGGGSSGSGTKTGN